MKKKDIKAFKNRKQADSDSIVVKLSEESSVEHRANRKYCILHGKCSHSLQKCKGLHATVIKHKQMRRQKFKLHRKSNMELSTLIEKKFQKFVKIKKGRKMEKEETALLRNSTFGQ